MIFLTARTVVAFLAQELLPLLAWVSVPVSNNFVITSPIDRLIM